MSGAFEIYLDTTPPNISIQCFDMVAWNENMPILLTITDDTDIEFQDIYSIDLDGTRREIVLTYQDGAFVGTINFSDYARGDATIYARMRDTVLNYKTISKRITIIWNIIGSVVIESLSQTLTINDTAAKLLVNAGDKW